MKKLLILGAGVMGSAMTVPADQRFEDIVLVGTHLDDDIILEMTDNKNLHPRHGLHLPPKVQPVLYSDLKPEHFHHVDLIILGVNSQGVDWSIDVLKRHLSTDAPILLITKGMRPDQDRLRCFPEIVQSQLKISGFTNKTAAVAGPCIALELVEKQPTGVLYTAESDSLLAELKQQFQTDYYRIQTSTDLIGVETCAAFKNLYAITTGAAVTRFKPLNPTELKPTAYDPAAFVFNQAIKEMRLLVDWVGGDSDTVLGLSCIGDLYVTVAAGRNSRLGRNLGQNKLYRNIIANELKGQTVEGADLAKEVNWIIQKMFQQGTLSRDQFPLMDSLLKAVCDNQEFSYQWKLM